MGKVFCLCELTAIERRVGKESERARQAGEVAYRGRVLDASFDRAERLVLRARVRREDRDGFLGGQRQTAIVRG